MKKVSKETKIHKKNKWTKPANKIMRIIGFYMKQALKSILIMIVAYFPTFFANQYALSNAMAGYSARQLYINNSNLQIATTFAAICLGIGIWSVLFKINWKRKDNIEKENKVIEK